VAFDKSEGVVKAQNSLAVVFHRFASQSGGEPKPWNSHGESAFGGSFRQPSIRPEHRPWFFYPNPGV